MSVSKSLTSSESDTWKLGDGGKEFKEFFKSEEVTRGKSTCNSFWQNAVKRSVEKEAARSRKRY